MNNSLRIMALKPEEMHRVVFVNGRNEGGINSVWDPSNSSEVFQVFIHTQLPYNEIEHHEFARFEEARSHASRTFKDWEMLTWDLKTRRPCEEGGKECGSGECDTCKEIKLEGGLPPAEAGCGSCGGA